METSQKKKEKKIYTYYAIEGDKITKKLKKCPRCGVFMAFHKEPTPRWTCGTCSYTDYATLEEKKE